MRSVDDSVDDGVAEVHVRVCHIQLGTKHHAALYRLGSVHLVEKLQAFLNGTVAVRRSHTWSSRCALLFCNLLCCLLVNVSVSVLYHPYGELPKLIEIVGSIIYVAPLESEPRDVVQNVLHILVVLLCRVGIVKADVADTVIFLGYSKVHTYGLGVSDVQVSVWLWRETCLYTSTILAFCEIGFNHLLYKTKALLLFNWFFFCCSHMFLTLISVVLFILRFDINYPYAKYAKN